MHISIPQDWKQKKLQEVALIQTGLAKGGKKTKNPVTMPYLRVANVQDGYLDLSLIKKIKVDQDKVSRYLLKDGDVLLTEGGDFDKLGRGTIWSNQISPCLHQNHIFVVRPLTSQLIPEYLSSFTQSFHGKKYFQLASKQTTNLATINSTQLKNFPIPLPPIAEQKKIAEILGTCDRQIELTENLINAKRKLKQGLMQKLLTGKLRFPEFEGQKWGFKLLKECTTLIKDGTHGTHQRLIEGIPLLSAANIEDGRINFAKNITYISQGDYDSIHKNYSIQVDDILLTIVGSLGRVAIVQNSDFPFTLQRSVGIIRFDKQILPKFAYHYFSTSKFQDDLYKRANITAQAGVYLKALEKIRVPCLLIQEQRKICLLFDELDADIKKIKDSLACLQALKKGLMQQLLTGKTRVKVD